MARTPICKFALAFPKVVSAWFESARGMSVSVARRERRRETSRWRRARRARLRLMDFFFVRRVEQTSRLDRVTIDTGTPRPREPERSGPPGDARGVASRFAGERRATYPVTTPRWLSARWCTPSCRSGRRLEEGRIVSRTAVGTSEMRDARARWGTHRKADTPARGPPAPRPPSGERRSTATPSWSPVRGARSRCAPRTVP